LAHNIKKIYAYYTLSFVIFILLGNLNVLFVPLSERLEKLNHVIATAVDLS